MIGSDDVAIIHIKPVWVDNIMHRTWPADWPVAAKIQTEGDALVCILSILDGDGRAHLFTFPCVVGPQENNADGSVARWGLERLGPGVWAIDQSYRVHGLLHAFLTVRDVPEPAPFLASAPSPGKDGGA